MTLIVRSSIRIMKKLFKTNSTRITNRSSSCKLSVKSFYMTHRDLMLSLLNILYKISSHPTKKASQRKAVVSFCNLWAKRTAVRVTLVSSRLVTMNKKKNNTSVTHIFILILSCRLITRKATACKFKQVLGKRQRITHRIYLQMLFWVTLIL